jgi:nucleoside-diphosphate-sugar epimerase
VVPAWESCILIVLFGASSDIGQRLQKKLESAGLEVRRVSRRLPDGFRADLATVEGVDEAVRGADKVVSCAHARYTEVILKACAPATPVVLTGSTWRFSKVPNPAADQVRAAERLFLASGNPGVMLHSSMIYGGYQERNVQRLVSVLKRFPIIPIPGGGRQLVRPIYVDDLVECMFRAVQKVWDAPTAFAVAGPPITWRDMAAACAEAMALKRSFVTIPLSPAITLFEILRWMGVKAPNPDILRRFSESPEFSTQEMTSLLGVIPRPFEAGIRQAIRGWENPNRKKN